MVNIWQQITAYIQHWNCDARLKEQARQYETIVQTLQAQIPTLPPIPRTFEPMLGMSEIAQIVAVGTGYALDKIKPRDQYYRLIPMVDILRFVRWAKVWELRYQSDYVFISEGVDCDDVARVLMGKLAHYAHYSRVPAGEIVFTSKSPPGVAHMDLLVVASSSAMHAEPCCFWLNAGRTGDTENYWGVFPHPEATSEGIHDMGWV